MAKSMTQEQRRFLGLLWRWQGVASSRDLGPQTSQAQNSARQTCRRRGWVTYDGGNDGYWRMTEEGRTAYQADMRTPAHT